MGIKPTALYKAFTFGGESSADYGAFLTGEGVFNAPERAVEMIEVPGRNGSFAMDMGRFENVELTYNASIVDFTSADFADRISALRNWLCSKRGYIRLEDEYNPDEYRMAVYKSGLEVDHDGLLTGEFDITFDCKPQRWLKSGETATSVTSGDEIVNPTLFDSSPLLAVNGYGGIHFNGFDVTITGTNIGWVVLFNSESFSNSPKVITIDDTYANSGDTIKLDGLSSTVRWNGANNVNSIVVTNVVGNGTMSVSGVGSPLALANVTQENILFAYGTARTETTTATLSIDTSAYGTLICTATWSIAYNGSDTFTVSSSQTQPINTITPSGRTGFIYDINLYSTQSILGNPLYIDCDIGEAYKIENSSIVSINEGVILDSQLPTLAVGTNTITYDNTITDLKIYPRWWRV